MADNSARDTTTVHWYDAINFVATDNLARDQTQSRRLHEPSFQITTIDPITGEDLKDLKGLPSLVDGNITLYFASEETRREFMEMPVDHPFHLIDNPYEEGEAEG